MKIEVFFSPAGVDELSMRGRNVVIIDVLRASTTICTALRNGAREIIPVPDIENATKISANLSSDSRLLGGERQGKRIDGFDLGNSPLEYTPEKVRGKTIIFTTTNGAGAMYKCRYAALALVGTFVNVSSIVKTITDVGGTWTILCSGRQGSFSVEDATCAGMIISSVQESIEVETDDAGMTAVILYKNHKRSILGMLKKAEHGKYLTSIGFSEDLKFCAEVDSVPVIPISDGVAIRLRPSHVELREKSPKQVTD
ncbi:MAG: 2-phosphosulfolactate phosphatase [Bacteroidetes bacterium]|nr:2-phosphosulfolactate phosphatase [Bacteroidota bacterium]